MIDNTKREQSSLGRFEIIAGYTFSKKGNSSMIITSLFFEI